MPREQATGALPTIVNPARSSPQKASQICGQCHSEFDPRDNHGFYSNGMPYRAGGDLDKSHRIFRFDDIRHERGKHTAAFYSQFGYWSDGTCRAGGDEFLGMIESPCYKKEATRSGRKGISCLSCHSMHASNPNDQLKTKMDGDHACLQCHNELRGRIREHTHHPAGSSGSRCYNCHMPHTSYALFTAMRSHRIDVPNVETCVRSGRPNACNLCHLDKTLAWTSRHLTQWYGAEEVKLDEENQTIPASLLWLLRGDAAQRVIAAWHMGWKPAQTAAGTGWQTPFLGRTLEDPYSVVRYVAWRALQKQPGFHRFEYDFIGDERDRSNKAIEVRKLWQGNRLRAPRNPGPKHFFDEKGAIRHDEIDRLLQLRDDRPIFLPE